MKSLLPEEAREQLGIRGKTKFEFLTDRPKSLAYFLAANITCEN